ncbi:MAG: PKD domain-containing protein [Candidatus Thermoplasmatota archaeon]|nr:PKD domain-containing protein [Candidatus Thermoplasmatota archaeon]
MKINKMKKTVALIMILGFFVATIASANAGVYGNRPPNNPQTPEGPTGGGMIFNRVVAGNSYTYTTITNDPDGDSVYYKWDWGDGTNSDWDGPWSSGVGVEGSHTWAEAGVYQVKVKAKDSHNASSGWSQPLNVTVSNRLSSVYTGSMSIGSSGMCSNSVLLKKTAKIEFYTGILLI